MPVADARLVVDLDDGDVAAPPDADARRLEAVDLEPLRAPALADRPQTEAGLVEQQPLPRDHPADAADEPDERGREHGEAGAVAAPQHRPADGAEDEGDPEGRVCALAVRGQ